MRLSWTIYTINDLFHHSGAALVPLGSLRGSTAGRVLGASLRPNYAQRGPGLPDQCNGHPSCRSIGPQHSTATKAAEQQTTPRAPYSRHAAQLAAQDGV